jgi:hypothetical protein
MKKALVTIAASLIALIASQAMAHHSAAAYDRANFIAVRGEVTEIHWVNPHTWVYINVTGADGQPQAWSLEGESVGQYVRMGWTPESLQIGDIVEAHVWQLKDGSYGAQLGYLVLEDGTILGEVPEETE